jgi:anaerobic ribonucleoside-triphosphate reductase activating protein
MAMQDSDLRVNLGVHPRDVPITDLSGPGRRFPLWTQGCSHRCTDYCISPQLLDVRPRYVLAVTEVLSVLEQRARCELIPIEGVTFLGGEPTEQALPLAAIAAAVRNWGWNVMTYSGHTLQKLQRKADPAINDLLRHTDILVDGPFVKHLANPLLRWRGSSNQRILFLSGRYSSAEVEAMPVVKGVDITLTTDGRLLLSGGQSKEFVERLTSALRDSNAFEIEPATENPNRDQKHEKI